ncbi:MAG: nucleotide exchange factor GrpE [Fidelibacterota bacterium]
MSADSKTTKPKKGKPKKSPPSKTAKGESKRLKELTSELAELKLAYNALEDRHLRLRAEFENYRKLKEREFGRILQYEGKDAIIAILPVVDDLERIVNADNSKNVSIDSVVEGVTLILDNLSRRLSKLGVESFSSVGEKFDPDLHDALMVKESNEQEEDIVIEEFEKGYRMKDKVIRHAKVVVSK